MSDVDYRDIPARISIVTKRGFFPSDHDSCMYTREYHVVTHPKSWNLTLMSKNTLISLLICRDLISLTIPEDNRELHRDSVIHKPEPCHQTRISEKILGVLIRTPVPLRTAPIVICSRISHRMAVIFRNSIPLLRKSCPRKRRQLRRSPEISL